MAYSKPSLKTKEYDEFLSELYRFDKDKKGSRKRREVDDKVDIPFPEAELEYNVPTDEPDEGAKVLKELETVVDPSEKPKSKREVLNINESNDELNFEAPSDTDVDYKQFIQYLYRHDNLKIKRDTSEAVYKDYLSNLYRNDRFKNPTVRPDFQPQTKPETPQFVIPKPRKIDPQYNDFLGNLYKNDKLKSRAKRETVELYPTYYETEIEDLDDF